MKHLYRLTFLAAWALALFVLARSFLEVDAIPRAPGATGGPAIAIDGTWMGSGTSANPFGIFGGRTAGSAAIPYATGTGSITWRTPATNWQYMAKWDDELTTVGSTGADTTWGTILFNGAGAGITTTFFSNHPSTWQLSTGTTTTGRISWCTRGDNFTFDATNVQEAHFIIDYPVLATAAQPLFDQIGFIDSCAGADQTDGIYFEYDILTTTAQNPRIVVANAGARTKQTLDGTSNTTAVTIVAATFYDLVIRCGNVPGALATPQCNFYWVASGAALGTPVGTICANAGCSINSGNIPTGTTYTGLGLQHVKNAVGTTALILNFDLAGYQQVFATSR